MSNILKGIFYLVFVFPLAKASAQNYVATYAGSSGGLINGDSASAKFNNPVGICLDRLGNFYITDVGNHVIRKVDNAGNVTTYAGAGIAGYQDGSAATARFNQPWGICVDDSLNLFVSDFLNQRIRKITPSGQVITMAGSGIAGLKNGKGDTAQLNYPRGICKDKWGNLYIADSWNHRIRKIDTAGMVSTYAGNGTNLGVSTVGALKDTVRSYAEFYTPTAVVLDSIGNLLVADAYNHAIRKIDTAGKVTTIVGGNGSGPSGGDFLDGSFAAALLNIPTELYWDESNKALLFSEIGNQRIRKINFKTSKVETFAGDGTPGNKNGRVDTARFDYPRGIGKRNDMYYVCDFNNHQIRKVFLKSNASGWNEIGNILPIYWKQENVIELGTGNEDIEISIYGLLGNKIPFDQKENLIYLAHSQEKILFVTIHGTHHKGTIKLVKP